ncbi:nucleoside 2-deoxyribosyltransferase [Schleiferilactobacillus harbinensis]|uniref:nucleoside 2-deoxyribosyltransferase n=1 Tax=Schleiferilactobacillus harbinensis TaxID=304207 RepID=UPI0039ECCECB
MKKLFFVTPIGDKDSDARRTADFVMNTFLKPVADELGYDVIRADLIQTVADISDSVIEQLENANLVVADISNANPNVMFELGYRFALKKPYLILTQDIKSIPFDIRGIRSLPYTVHAPDIKDFKSRLNQMIRVIEATKTPANNSMQALGEQMGADLVINAIQSGDFSSIKGFLDIANEFGVKTNEDDK